MGRPKSRYPKELRKRNYRAETQLTTPFQEMSNCDIVLYFLRSRSFIKTYMNYTKSSYENARKSIRESLIHVEQEEFATFVKICQRSFKAKDQDRRGFYHYIISFLQDCRNEFFLSTGEELLEEEICQQWLFPSLAIDNSNRYLYDISYDFFIENMNRASLRTKYNLFGNELKKILKEIKKQEITPLPL
ncbi:MAG: hypothetical protein PHY47_01245 [Lachnospiraceae bacterium]|nr:hypothetical protein [Lachnospiraceae bacterium]